MGHRRRRERRRRWRAIRGGGLTGGAIAVGVSGQGSNLQALLRRQAAGGLGGSVRLVFADRACGAVGLAAEQPHEIRTLVLPDLAAADAERRAAAEDELVRLLDELRIELVVLAGYLRLLGRRVTDRYRGRILNTHPSLLPAFPGAHAVRDALAHGVRVTGTTVHLVDETLDGGPIVLQEPVAVQPDDTESTLHARIKAVEHRLLPRAVALTLAGAVRAEEGGRRVRLDAATADRRAPRPRLALLSVSDKAGLVAFATGLRGHGFDLVASGGTAASLTAAGLDVIDVSAVTGFPEMLDGRVKTLHPRIHAGLLADQRRPEHREALLAAGIDAFEIVAVNLYPFERAAARGDVSLDELIEEIDIGGPALVRAAAKNHRGGVTVVTDPAVYDEVLAAVATQGHVPDGLRARLALDAFRHTAAYDARIAAELPRRLDGGDPTGAHDPFPERLTIGLEKVATLRYGENPHQPGALYRRPGTTPTAGPFARGAAPLQGKELSYNNVLDASAAAAIARLLRGPAVVIVKHTNPCGAAERQTLGDAWRATLAGDPVSAFGGVVATTRPVDAATAAALAEIFLEVVVAPGFDEDARAVLARRSNLRLLVDEALGAARATSVPDPLAAVRTAGGAVLVTAPDVAAPDASSWRLASRRAPSDAERRDLDLAWRLVRFVTSNAIVLVRDGALIGVGSGQTSRVDAARQAVAKALAIHGPDAVRGSACASDAFFPFPDGVEACAEAGVSAFVQPGGSVRDGDVVAAADAAGAAMLLTGTRHFRH